MLSVLLTSFAAVLVFLIGARYISTYTGFAGGMIFSLFLLLAHAVFPFSLGVELSY
jgi:hypothetical protein